MLMILLILIVLAMLRLLTTLVTLMWLLDEVATIHAYVEEVDEVVVARRLEMRLIC